MEYIDKNNREHKESAHAILDDFLKRYQKGGLPFPEDLYDALKNDRKEGINTFLNYSERILEENECRCCYCMRTIRRNVRSQRYPVTLEHVILNCINTEEDYNKYTDYDSNLDMDNIILTANFLRNPKWPPYPHRIAYENLIPSCMGLFPSSGSANVTCNLGRGNKYVPPLVFRETIRDEIRYYDDGTIAWTEDPGDGDVPYVNKLGLNFIALRLIRLAWYYLNREGIDYTVANKNKIKSMILADIDEDTVEGREMVESINKLDLDWSLMNDFQYFNDINKFTSR